MLGGVGVVVVRSQSLPSPVFRTKRLSRCDPRCAVWASIDHGVHGPRRVVRIHDIGEDGCRYPEVIAHLMDSRMTDRPDRGQNSSCMWQNFSEPEFLITTAHSSAEKSDTRMIDDPSNQSAVGYCHCLPILVDSTTGRAPA